MAWWIWLVVGVGLLLLIAVLAFFAVKHPACCQGVCQAVQWLAGLALAAIGAILYCFCTVCAEVTAQPPPVRGPEE